MYKVALKSLILLLTATLFFGGCETKVPEPFLIGINLWPGYEPLHLAQQRGDFTRSIEIKTLNSATDVLSQFRQEKVHAAALTLDETLLLKDQGFDPVIIAVLDISEGADVILAKTGIETLADLKGKTIAVENSALGSYILARALQIGGLRRTDVEVLPVNFNEHEEVFTKGVVDAVITFEPIRSALLKKGAHEIFSSKEIPNEIVDVLVVHRKYLDSALVSDMLQGWGKASEAITMKESEAIAIAAEHQKQTPAEFIASLDGLKIPTRTESDSMFNDKTLQQSIEKVQQIMLEKSLIQKTFKATAILP